MHLLEVLRAQRRMDDLHGAGEFLHDGVARHAEVRQITGRPQQDHLQALEHQHHLVDRDIHERERERETYTREREREREREYMLEHVN